MRALVCVRVVCSSSENKPSRVKRAHKLSHVCVLLLLPATTTAVALLTERIRDMAEHVMAHKKDHVAKRYEATGCRSQGGRAVGPG